jgi:hypothetical protein
MCLSAIAVNLPSFVMDHLSDFQVLSRVSKITQNLWDICTAKVFKLSAVWTWDPDMPPRSLPACLHCPEVQHQWHQHVCQSELNVCQTHLPTCLINRPITGEEFKPASRLAPSRGIRTNTSYSLVDSLRPLDVQGWLEIGRDAAAPCHQEDQVNSTYVRTQTCETMRNWDKHGVTSLAGTTPLVESPSQNVYPRCGATGVYWSEDTSLFHWQTRWYLPVPNSECGPCILASVCIIKGALWECVNVINVIIKHSTSDQYPSFPERWWKRDYLNLWMNSADSKALAPLDPSRPMLFWVA